MFLGGSYLTTTASVTHNYTKNYICDALHDLVPFVQFQKREKHPWRSVFHAF